MEDEEFLVYKNLWAVNKAHKHLVYIAPKYYYIKKDFSDFSEWLTKRYEKDFGFFEGQITRSKGKLLFTISKKTHPHLFI